MSKNKSIIDLFVAIGVGGIFVALITFAGSVYLDNEHYYRTQTAEAKADTRIAIANATLLAQVGTPKVTPIITQSPPPSTSIPTVAVPVLSSAFSSRASTAIRNVSIGLVQLVSEFTEAVAPCHPLVWAD